MYRKFLIPITTFALFALLLAFNISYGFSVHFYWITSFLIFADFLYFLPSVEFRQSRYFTVYEVVVSVVTIISALFYFLKFNDTVTKVTIVDIVAVVSAIGASMVFFAICFAFAFQIVKSARLEKNYIGEALIRFAAAPFNFIAILLHLVQSWLLYMSKTEHVDRYLLIDHKKPELDDNHKEFLKKVSENSPTDKMPFRK